MQSFTTALVAMLVAGIAGSVAPPVLAQTDDGATRAALCGSESGSDLAAMHILSGTGDASIDRALIEELNTLSRFYGIRPAFFVYAGNPRTAMATLETHPQTPRTDGTVLYQLGMLKEHLTSAEYGGSIVSGVIAHEFAHILQCSDPDLFLRLASAHGSVKFLELHADFIAGYYMGTKFAAKPWALETLSRKIFELGDTHFNSPGHHGTAEERHIALKAGFRFYLAATRTDIGAVLTEGEAFVTSVFPAY